MNPNDIQAIELVIIGWVFGVQTCLLYASVKNYIEVKRGNND